MRFIWATRGRSWGFRFLESAGIEDPLPDYETVFSQVGDDRVAWRRVGDSVAVRFEDPSGRTDAAGRVIPHEFVVFAPDAAAITSVEDGRELLWPRVSEQYDAIWDRPSPM